MEPSEKEANRGSLEPATAARSGFAAATPQSCSVLEPKKSGSTGRTGKGTGPRTLSGKQRASRNATTHGVFSNVVVLPDESRTEYEGLIAGLRDAFQPVGAMEELLVEKLATSVWRKRRMLSAEAAEIRKTKELVEWDRQEREHEEADDIVDQLTTSGPIGPVEVGLIRKSHNLEVLGRCLQLLSQLREGIEAQGFDRDRDLMLLERIYGDRINQRLREDLYDEHERWLETLEDSEQERIREGYASADECRMNVIKAVDREIDHLKRYHKARTSMAETRTRLEIQGNSVPDEGLERFLRYEAALERNFDRTLTQLERLQRMRLGQPVAPPIKVQVS